MRESISFQILDVAVFKVQLLKWCNHFSNYCILDSNGWNSNKNELIAAIGSVNAILPNANSFEELKKFHAAKKDWLFGHLSYDLKNETEKLSSENFDGVGFPQMHFFQPEYIFHLAPALPFGEGVLKIGFLPHVSSREDVENMFREITNHLPITIPTRLPAGSAGGLDGQVAIDNRSSITNIRPRISEEEYISTVKKIKHHIKRGDIYEMNYCMEFFCDDARINPAEVFLQLSEASQAPFSAFYRTDNKYLMCASPERFLKKSGKKIISQPIKGTAKRSENIFEDLEIKKMLGQNEKEKSENVMIVDLVRNDLSKSCNHVNVDELFGVYTFKQWHQMISTISGELRGDVDFSDVIKNSFPMGSMTGAPKVRAMELIEQYEKTKRGLYSGAVGYITPEGDFDLNVVIRSILYNQKSNYLSFQVGSAITANSVPENEYEECLLKAKGMFKALAKPLSPEH